jgi:Flp pilus assembly protein TadD
MRFRHAFLLLLAVLGAGSLPAQERGDRVITGTVREEGSDNLVAAATVEISHSGSQAYAPVISGTNGEFVFRDLPAGEFVVTAKKDGFNPASVTVSVERMVNEVTISLRRAIASGVHPGGAISAHQLQAPKKARADYEKGRRLLEDENQPADSISEFEKAVKEFPSYYEAYTELGIAKNRLGKVPEAETSLKQAIELSTGSYPKALYFLADLYNGRGKYQEAEPMARQAIALDDSDWNGFYELARSLVGLKRVSEAETVALRARDLAPQTPPVYLVLSNIHSLQQNYAAAIQDLDAYLKLKPDGQTSDLVRRTRDKLRKQVQLSPVASPAATPKPAAPQP